MDQKCLLWTWVLRKLLWADVLRAICGVWGGVRLCGLSSAGNVVAAVVLSLAVTGAAASQPAGGVDTPMAMRAHQAAARWVTQAKVDDMPAEPMPSAEVFGVRVTLRYQGILMGVGDAFRRDLAAAPAGDRAVDVLGLLRTATENALDDVRRRLDDINSRARAAERMEESDVASKRLADVAPAMLVDLQIGYGIETVRLPAGSPESALLGTFVPGYDGLRTAEPGRPDAPGGITWPGTALAGNIPPAQQVLGTVAAAGYPATAAGDAGRPDGPPLQRFRIAHIVRPSSPLPATPLVRGNRPLPPTNITDEGVEILAHRLGEHLGQRLIGQQLVRGTYHPTTGQWDPQLADDEDAALALFATARYLEAMRAHRGLVPASLERTLADTTLTRLRAAARGGETEVSTGALLLLAAGHQPKLAAEQTLRADLTARLLAMQREPGVFARSAGSDRTAGDAALSILAAALAEQFDRTREARIAEALVPLMTQLRDRLAASPSLSTLYWLALARTTAAARLPEHAELWQSYADLLARLVNQLADRQVVGPPAVGPADVVGGFDLGGTPPGGAPEPNWRSAQALAFVAHVLRDEDVHGDADQLGWMLTAGLAGRFLDQLVLDAASGFYVRDPAVGLYGLRLSMVDNRLATAPTAVGTIAASELLATLDWVRSRIDPASTDAEAARTPAERAITAQEGDPQGPGAAPLGSEGP